MLKCKKSVQQSNTLSSLGDSPTIWFPRNISQLKYVMEREEPKTDLSLNNPGYNDIKYKIRKNEIREYEKLHIIGQPIPKVEYTEEENNTWSRVFYELSMLYPTHACSEYNKGLQILINNSIYTPTSIPQLENVANFIKAYTGFTLIPVSGFLTFRDFFVGLAFKVFYCTQYIRHPLAAQYNPEPDLCHELLGHVPLLLDLEYANFLHEIGLATLGLPDQIIEKISNIFWFTVEFGLCKEKGKLKAYGGGILSSYGELEYALSSIAITKLLNINEMEKETYDMTEYQNIYYYGESLNYIKDIITNYTTSFSRDYKVIYDSRNQRIDFKNASAT